MTDIVLGVDQGTSSTRCLAFDADLRERGSASVAVAASFPGPGLVEQDPEELVTSVRTAVAGAMAAAGCGHEDVVAVGIANQTETFLVCDRESGRALHPAIVWQDRRTADVCRSLGDADLGSGEPALAFVRKRTGLELDATFPATKIAWLLGAIDGARARAEAGELVYADVAGWLLRRLLGVEACEASNAGRTLLCGLEGLDWDDELLGLFGVPRAMMPAIVDSDRVGAPGGSALGELPVAAVLGDQQASLFGLGCHAPGSAKVTLGTGAFILAQAGASAPSPPEGVLASCAWRRLGETRYALEGFIPTAGAALSWFADLGVLPLLGELDGLLREGSRGDDADMAVCVPALQGLGTPSWDAGARGALFGLSRATSRPELARAIVDGVLHQVADAVAAIGAAMPLSEVLLDGGMARSDWIAQRLADLAGVRVARSVRPEATATGAAMLAGLAAGVWRDVDELPPAAADLVCEPSMGDARRAALRDQWAQAVALSGQWGR